MSQQLWEGKSTDFLCFLQALGCPWQLLWHCSGDTCTLYCIPQLWVLPGALWERWNREVYTTFQADTEPHTALHLIWRWWEVCDKGAKQQSTAVPCRIPRAPLLPSTADGNRNYFRYNSKWGSSQNWRHTTSPTQIPGSWEKERDHTKHYRIFPVKQGPLYN